MENYFKLIPKTKYRLGVYIVGGAAVNYVLATDVDVVLIHKYLNIEIAREILEALREKHGDNFIENDSFGFTYDNGEFVKMLAGSIKNKTEKNVQILLSFPDIESTLDKFDISTHSYAVDSQGNKIKGKFATSIFEKPRVLRFTTPQSTLNRYLKICARYGHSPNISDLQKLGRLAEITQQSQDWYEQDLS